MSKTENWNSKLGAVLAVAGSAVGFGNFLRFPGLAAQYGGGAFMIAYFCAFLLLGIPLSWVEWTLGRRGGALGGHSCASIFLLITQSRLWKYIGVIAVISPLGIGMYYMYLEGWTLGYTYNMAVGNLNLESSQAYEDFFVNFVGLSAHGSAFDLEKSGVIIFFGIALLANFYLLYRGVSKGIEWFCKWSMPVLLITAFIILVRVLTLGTPNPDKPECNVTQGLGYMWNPAKTEILVEGKTVEMMPPSYTEEERRALLQKIAEQNSGKEVKIREISLLQGLMNPELWITAAGQIFFSLSIGFGTIATYASYVAKKEDIVLSSLTANAANEVVEVGVAGMMIVPAAVSLLGVAAAAGASTFGLGFNVLPQVFSTMPGGQIFGTLFFGLLSLAAVASSLSILQPSIAFMEEFWNMSRTQSAVLVNMAMTAGALIVTWFTGDDLVALDTLDFWVGTMCIYLISGLYLYIFRFKWGTEKGLQELQKGALLPVPKLLGFAINWVTPSILLFIFASWAYKNIFVQTCPQIRKLLDGNMGAILPLAWVGCLFLFMLFVAHTSRRFHESVRLEEQKDRIPFS